MKTNLTEASVAMTALVASLRAAHHDAITENQFAEIVLLQLLRDTVLLQHRVEMAACAAT